MFFEVNWRVRTFPDNLGNEIILAKYFIAKLFEIFLLIIVNAGENHAILAQ